MGRLGLGICVVSLLAMVSPASAQREQRLRLRAPDEVRPGRITVQAGGGYSNFTENGTRDLTTPGGLWTVRASSWANRWLGVEAGYIGTANGFDPPTGGDAAILRNGFDVDLKLGYPVAVGNAYVAPYGLIGLGIDFLVLAGAEGNRAGADTHDTAFALPVGVGLTAGLDRYSLDARFAFRSNFGDAMFDSANRTIYTAGTNSLAFTLAAGYTF